MSSNAFFEDQQREAVHEASAVTRKCYNYYSLNSSYVMLCYVMLCYFPYVTPIIKEVWPVIKEQCPLDNLLLLCWVPVSSYFNKLRRDVI